ncbi:MAG: PIN domain-containing protein [Gemmatimonadaceae bacterium]
MIALDTNVLLRFVLADECEPQTAIAERWMRRHAARGIYVDDIVLCEVEWVLRARYRWRRAAVAALLEELCDAEALTLGDPSRVRHALEAYRAGKGDFSDYLIRERAKQRGAVPVATLDRAIGREQGFQLLG